MPMDVKVIEYFHAKIPHDVVRTPNKFCVIDAVQYILHQLQLLYEASNTESCFFRYMDISINSQSFYVEYSPISKDLFCYIASFSKIEEIKLYLYYQIQNSQCPELCPSYLEEKLSCAEPNIFDNLVYGIDIFPTTCMEYVGNPRGYYKYNGQIHRGEVDFCSRAVPADSHWHSVNIIANLENYPCTENDRFEIEPLMWSLERFGWYPPKLYTPEEVAAEAMIGDLVGTIEQNKLTYYHSTVVINDSSKMLIYIDKLKKLVEWCRRQKTGNQNTGIRGTVHPAFLFSHDRGLQMMKINPNVFPMQIMITAPIQGDFE